MEAQMGSAMKVDAGVVLRDSVNYRPLDRIELFLPKETKTLVVKGMEWSVEVLDGSMFSAEEQQTFNVWKEGNVICFERIGP